MLDRLSPQLRHFLIMIGAVLLTALCTALKSNLNDLIPVVFKGMPPVVYVILAGVFSSSLSSAILYFTKLTKQYGTGSDTGSGSPDPQPVSDAPVVSAPVNDAGSDSNQPTA